MKTLKKEIVRCDRGVISPISYLNFSFYFICLLLCLGCERSLIEIEGINKKSILKKDQSDNFFGGKIIYGLTTIHTLQNGHELYLLNKTTNQLEKVQDFGSSLNLQTIGSQSTSFPYYFKDKNTSNIYRLDANYTLHLLGTAGNYSSFLVKENFLIVYQSATVSSFADAGSNGLESIASAFQVDPVLYNGLHAYVQNSIIWGVHTGTASNKLLLFDGKNRTFREIPNTQNQTYIADIITDEENFAVLKTSPGDKRFILNLKNGNLTEIVDGNSEKWISSFSNESHSYVITQSASDNTKFKLYELNTTNGAQTYLNSFPASSAPDYGESCFSYLELSNQRIFNQATSELILLCSPRDYQGEIYTYNTSNKNMAKFVVTNDVTWEDSKNMGTYENLFYFNGSLYLSSAFFNSNGTLETKKVNLSNNQINFGDDTELYQYIQTKICGLLVSSSDQCDANVLSVDSIGSINNLTLFMMITVTIDGESYIVPTGMIMNNQFYMSTPIKADTDPNLMMSLMMLEQFKIWSNVFSGNVIFKM